MTRDELKDLACLGFNADFTLQTFCHTAAYPKPVDIKTQQELPDFFANRGGVALRPGDGIIHSWWFSQRRRAISITEWAREHKCIWVLLN